MGSAVALYLNRRLRSQAIHDLNAVNGHCLRFKYSATVELAKLPCALTMALQSEELNIFQRVLGENVQIERELRGVLGVNLRSGRLAQASARLAQPGHNGGR
jgi:hypothetical protein